MSGATEPTVAELVELVHTLSARVEQLEAALSGRRPSPPVPDDVVVAIAAAVAAFLGHRAKVKQVHYRTGAAYAQQGRAVVQGRHDVHGPR